MEIFKTDVLKKELERIKKKILFKYLNMVIAKRLLADLGIKNFVLVVNTIEEHFVKLATVLI